MPIDSIHRLRASLQVALQVELATIPPYLTALYSIREGHNSEAAQIIQSVVMEEMLHMALVANLLNAIGGSPRLHHPDCVPVYPGYLPHSAKRFTLNLLKFSKPALQNFLAIERHEKVDAGPEGDFFHTIGQFYDALRNALVHLVETLGEENVFVGSAARQVAPEFYYGGSGELLIIDDLASAKLAIAHIVDEGEGIANSIFDGDQIGSEREQLAHYFRFNSIYMERYYTDNDTPQSGPRGARLPVDWNAVYNMAPNPRSRDYPAASAIRRHMDDFNRLYTSLLFRIERSFNGQPEQLMQSVGMMYELKYKAVELMKIPSGKGDQTVGPSFEFLLSEDGDRG